MQVLNINSKSDGESSADDIDLVDNIILTANCVVQLPFVPPQMQYHELKSNQLA